MPLFSSSSNTAVCSFEVWTPEGFHFFAVLHYSNVYSTCSIGWSKLNAYGDAEGSLWLVILKDHHNYPLSINVYIMTEKNINCTFQLTTTISSLQPSKGVCTHVRVLCRGVSGLYLLFLSYHSQSASTFQQMPAPLTFTSTLWPPVIKRPPPNVTPIPWSPISKAGPFPRTDAEVEAPRGRNVERRYQGSVRWRSHEGHGSLGGWAMSRGAWRAEAGLSHRPSSSQSVLQCSSTNWWQPRHKNSTHTFGVFLIILWHIYLNKTLRFVGFFIVFISVSVHVRSVFFIFIISIFFLIWSIGVWAPAALSVIKIQHCSLRVNVEKDQSCVSVDLPQCCFLLSHFIPSLIASDKRPHVATW